MVEGTPGVIEDIQPHPGKCDMNHELGLELMGALVVVEAWDNLCPTYNALSLDDQ